MAVDPTREQGSDPIGNPVGEPDPEEAATPMSEGEREEQILEEEEERER